MNLQAILGSLTEGVLVSDREGKIVLANGQFLRMFDVEEVPLRRTVMEATRLVEVDRAVEEINEAEYKGREVELNHPTRSSGPKKYKVYVKNPKTGNVKVVHFGDVSGGLSAKVSDPKARKSFAARHQCHLKKDKTKAGYWACRLNRYGHLFGGKTYPGYW